MAHPGFNCRHCGDAPRHGRRRKGHARYRRPKREPNRVLTATRAFCLARRGKWVRKEEIATRYGFREHQVALALHQLNLEGLVSLPRHAPPHDCNRSYYGGPDSSWCGSIYDVYDHPGDYDDD